MTSHDEPVPDQEAINRQLRRLLGSNRFKIAKNPSDFLSLVVRRALSGKNTTEDIIGKTLFDSEFSSDESAGVRVTASNLRKTLTKYYAAEGADDPVIIALPQPPADRTVKLAPGEAYRPIFRYNPRHEIAKEYELGMFYLHPRNEYLMAHAVEHFARVITLEPTHVRAYIGCVEAFSYVAFLQMPAEKPEYFLNTAAHWAMKAVALNPTDWHAQCAHGLAFLLNCEFERAASSFNTALKLNREHTLEYGGYHLFLFLTNRTTEALSLAQAKAEGRLTDPYNKAVYGLYLYLERDFDKAQMIFAEAINLDHNCWLARIGAILLSLVTSNYEEANIHNAALQPAVNYAADKYFLPGLAAICIVKGNVMSVAAATDAVKRLLDTSPFVLAFQTSLLHLARNASALRKNDPVALG